MEDYHPILESIMFPGKKVLATILHVDGSAYKKEGSMMLFHENGTQIGMLSAGCLETDLEIRAEQVLIKKQPITVQYDMTEQTDLAWGQGAGCNGKIDILLEPVTDDLKRNLTKIKDLLSKQIPVLGLKNLHTSEYLFIPQKGLPFGNWQNSTFKFSEVKSGMMGEWPVFQQLFHPKPRMIVFGAGADARPLVTLAADTGFSVLVCDWRTEFCQKKHFKSAEQIIVGFPKEILNSITCTSNDFVVIMSHDFQKDQEILLALLHEKVKYLGVLGPKERTKRLLQGREIPKSIDSPLGLAIGALGAEEIAVSIVAKMIQVLRNEKVSQLWTIPE